MEDIGHIIEELKALDLSQRPYNKVKALLGKFGKTVTIKVTLHPGSIIMRGRPNKTGERFSKISEISYKPANLNTTFQRASTPNNTMFYGSHIPDQNESDRLDTVRIIPLFEALPMMRDIHSSGEQVITYSKWRVIKEIPLVSIVYHSQFKGMNTYANQQRSDFERTIASLPQPIQNNTRLATTFLANEFAKEITPNDYDYIISATYTELITSNYHAAGVYYPSVRMNGEGFNVAIHPKFVHENLVLEAVGECTIYKKGQNTFVDNETIAPILTDQTEFELKPVLPEYHLGRAEVLKRLG